MVTVALVGVFTLGIVGTSPRKQQQPDGTVTAGTVPTALGRTGAYACFALCAAAVGYGIYLIVAK
ncbi:membrane protein [Streptomyces sp. NRRL B-1568]|nr:membrane protein [Streptomyces sp. NRRL B-1568]